MSPALAGRFFTTSATWEAHIIAYCCVTELPGLSGLTVYITSVPLGKEFSSGLPGYFAEGFRVSLMAQLVKNPPAMQETPVHFLGWEDPLGKGYATHSSILGLPLWLS